MQSNSSCAWQQNVPEKSHLVFIKFGTQIAGEHPSGVIQHEVVSNSALGRRKTGGRCEIQVAGQGRQAMGYKSDNNRYLWQTLFDPHSHHKHGWRQNSALTHSLNHSPQALANFLTSLTHPLTHSLTHPPAHSLPPSSSLPHSLTVIGTQQQASAL